MSLVTASWARRARALFIGALGCAAALGCAGSDSVDIDTEIGELEEPLIRELDVDDIVAERDITAPSAAQVRRLAVAKQVDLWPGQVDVPRPGTVVVELTVKECVWLGGTVTFWASCGTTLMKCVGASGREMCIDELAVAD